MEKTAATAQTETATDDGRETFDDRGSGARKTFEGGERDPSKARFVVLTDLILRALTAFGVLAVGIAGITFQRATEAARVRDDRTARSAQANLAEIRSLVELELDLRDASTHRYGVTIQKMHASARALSFDANSLFFAGQEPRVDLTFPVGLRPSTAKVTPSTSRVGALMIAEIIDVLAASTELRSRNSDVQISLGGPPSYRHVRVSNGSEWRYVFVSSQTTRFWQEWLTASASPADIEIYDYPSAAFRLTSDFIEEQQTLVRQHPELAERYVQIRNDVIRLHSLEARNER